MRAQGKSWKCTTCAVDALADTQPRGVPVSASEPAQHIGVQWHTLWEEALEAQQRARCTVCGALPRLAPAPDASLWDPEYKLTLTRTCGCTVPTSEPRALRLLCGCLMLPEHKGPIKHTCEYFYHR